MPRSRHSDVKSSGKQTGFSLQPRQDFWVSPDTILSTLTEDPTLRQIPCRCFIHLRLINHLPHVTLSCPPKHTLKNTPQRLQTLQPVVVTHISLVFHIVLKYIHKNLPVHVEDISYYVDSGKR